MPCIDNKRKTPASPVCPPCGAIIRFEDVNFCEMCVGNGKIVEVCNWWVVGEPFNCRFDKCSDFMKEEGSY